MRIGLFCMGIWLAAAAAGAARPNADTLWAQGDYRRAFAQSIEPAQRGDSHAQFLIGEAYRLGRSVDPNFPQAEDWYARAARQGDIAAATELGLLLASQHQYAQALPWLAIAARHGEARALCTLAAFYYNGDGVARDEALAFALMSRAAAAGLPEAQARLVTLRGLLSPDMQAKGAALVPAGMFDDTAPAPPAISQATDPARTPGAIVRVQVGAFRSAAAAERAWTALASRVEGIGQTDHAVERAGRYYRLQARLTDGDTARIMCGRLRAARWQHFTRADRPAPRIAQFAHRQPSRFAQIRSSNCISPTRKA
jgi:TPR repeat protein